MKYTVTVVVTDRNTLTKTFEADSPADARALAEDEAWTPHDGWTETAHDGSAEIEDISGED